MWILFMAKPKYIRCIFFPSEPNEIPSGHLDTIICSFKVKKFSSLTLQQLPKVIKMLHKWTMNLSSIFWLLLLYLPSAHPGVSNGFVLPIYHEKKKKISSAQKILWRKVFSWSLYRSWVYSLQLSTGVSRPGDAPQLEWKWKCWVISHCWTLNN